MPANAFAPGLTGPRLRLLWLASLYPHCHPPAGEEEDDVARRSHQRIGTLLKESQRLETILDDFLQFVKDRELHLEPCDLNVLIGELADFYRPQAESHAVSLDVETADTPLTCMLDVGLIKQALLNLMINAQQAMSDGGRLIICISAERQNPEGWPKGMSWN